MAVQFDQWTANQDYVPIGPSRETIESISGATYTANAIIDASTIPRTSDNIDYYWGAAAKNEILIFIVNLNQARVIGTVATET